MGCRMLDLTTMTEVASMPALLRCGIGSAAVSPPPNERSLRREVRFAPGAFTVALVASMVAGATSLCTPNAGLHALAKIVRAESELGQQHQAPAEQTNST